MTFGNGWYYKIYYVSRIVMLSTFTKLSLLAWIRQMVCSMWSRPYVDWVALDADQKAGGVLMMWDRRVLERFEVMVGSFSMLVWW